MASPDAVGRAFLGPDDTGHLADAYLEAVQDVADWHRGDSAALLGDVLAHELGHLILGSGHTSAGIMRAAWSPRELGALRKGRLQFTDDERQRIRVALRRTSPREVATNAEPAAPPVHDSVGTRGPRTSGELDTTITKTWSLVGHQK